MKKDSLGEHIKSLESITDTKLDLEKPAIARIDGRSFHSFTRGLKRPFDNNLSEMMIETTEHLVKVTGANIGYTQSDEITLVWGEHKGETQMWLGGRLFKLVSLIAAEATVYFNERVAKNIPDYLWKRPTFDTRVFNVPDRETAVLALIWRQRDALKNGISSISREYFSDKELESKGSNERLLMLESKGVYFHNYSPKFTRGTFVRPVKVNKTLSLEDIDDLPLQHNARKTPNALFERTIFERMWLLNLDNFLPEAVEMIFNGGEALKNYMV